jgi:hypothetical protein
LFHMISHAPVGDSERRRAIPGGTWWWGSIEMRREPGTMVIWYHVECGFFTTSNRSSITSSPILRVIPLDR